MHGHRNSRLQIILHFLNKLDDRNTDNHAYIANRSCQTAILGLIEYIKLFRAKAKEYLRLGKLLIPIILAEDISGAFESISHDIIAYFIQLCVDPTMSDVDLVGWILSYLDRESKIKENGEFAELRRAKKKQTSPQGSILSPKF